MPRKRPLRGSERSDLWLVASDEGAKRRDVQQEIWLQEGGCLPPLKRGGARSRRAQPRAILCVQREPGFADFGFRKEAGKDSISSSVNARSRESPISAALRPVIARNGPRRSNPGLQFPNSQFPIPNIFSMWPPLGGFFIFPACKSGETPFLSDLFTKCRAVRSHLISFLFSTNITKICGPTSNLFTIHDGKTRANFYIIE